MKKQSTILFSIASVFTVAAFAIVASSANKSIFDNVLRGDHVHSGYHYEANLSNEGEAGNLEFWMCCTDHQVFLKNPDGNFKDNAIGNISGAFDVNNPAYISYVQNYSSIQVRDNYEVVVDGTEDKVYKDANTYNFGGNSVKMLWDDNNVAYFLITKGNTTSSITPVLNFETKATITESSEVAYSVAGSGAQIPLTFRVVNNLAETTVYGGMMTLSANSNNNARHLFTAKYTTATNIEANGVKDDAYNTASSIAINVVNDGTTDTTGKAYMLWDNDFLYVFIEVSDTTINSNNDEAYWSTNHDSVEFYLSTCQTLPTSATYWGWNESANADNTNSMRPYKDYCGEMALWRKAGDPGCTFTGFHWLYDDLGGWVFLPNGSVASENSYTIEYKLAWRTFGTVYTSVEAKTDQIIDFSIIINDGDKSCNYKGQVATNAGSYILDPYNSNGLTYFDQLQLIA